MTNVNKYLDKRSLKPFRTSQLFSNSEEEQMAAIREQDALEAAEQAMKEPSFLERYRLRFQLSKAFTYFYHSISFLTACAFIAFISFYQSGIGLDNSAYEVGIASGCALLAVMVVLYAEITKKEVSTDLFRRWHRGGKVVSGWWTKLLLLTIFSISVSAFGGYFIGMVSSDKNEEISAQHQTSISKLERNFRNKESQLKTEIESIRNRNDYRKRYWSVKAKDYAFGELNELGKKLIEQKENTLQVAYHAYQKQKEEIDQQYSAIRKSSENNSYYTGLAMALMVLILELMSIYCYHFTYYYYANLAKISLSREGEETPVEHIATTQPDTFQTQYRLQDAKPFANETERENRNAIGFTFSNHNQELPTAKRQPVYKEVKAEDTESAAYFYWKTRPQLCEDLIRQSKGQLVITNRELATIHQCSMSTVGNARRAVVKVELAEEKFEEEYPVV
ncbi:hypothetical protein V6R21_05270 [Limibacter armeniacum]|uniref:hypothetical protein n=1 Tax=Limibacter armeniacum TaxID=466084 RepID=UPI002FE63FDC